MKEIKEIKDELDLDKALEHETTVILKNSTRCGISRNALGEYRNFAEKTDKNAELYIINILENRKISDEIEKRTEIRHESPQLIIFKKGKPVWNMSHWDITETEINDALER